MSSVRTKICPRCNESKPVTPEHFHRNCKASDGFSYLCKNCRSAHAKKKNAAPNRVKQENFKAANPLKKCYGCQTEHPRTLEYFYNASVNVDGLQGLCKACARKKTRDWVSGNKPAKSASDKMYREANKDALVRYFRKYHEEHRDAKLAYSKTYREENPQVLRAGQRRYRARKRNATGSHTTAEWLAKLAAYGGRCHWCGKKIKGAPHADHVIALSKGGTNYISNIVPSCTKCNMSKGAKSPLEYAGRLF